VSETIQRRQRELLRRLPSVEELARTLRGVPHRVAVAAAREQVAEARERILAGDESSASPAALQEGAAARAAALARPSLRAVINATGVILHTNLGRAPLAPAAVDAVAEAAARYSNLEYDLESGERGSRQAHVESLLQELTGAESALAVNNKAAAVTLALAAIASGREVVVSRGQLVEIGGSFRIPEILEASGARLVEVGTTNRTRLADYEAAMGSDTAALLRVHQSNFRTVGFVEEASLDELCALGAERGVAVIDDLGSGALAQIADEPRVRESIDAGVDLACFSADKLLGGPQAGILAGRAETVGLCRREPLARAVRIDKLQLAALQATLRLHREPGPAAVPALAMLAATEESLESRATRMALAIGPSASVIHSTSRPGGGALPLVELEGPVCVVDAAELGAEQLARRLEAGEPPVVTRIHDGRVVLDPRTITDEEAETAAEAVRRALA
jgi:L-seryl-tRNA(Ser) seleniumtransferase